MKIVPSKTNLAVIGLFGFFVSVGTLSAAIIPRGLLIYSDIPNYSEACEYSSLVVGPVYATVLRSNGRNFQLISTARITPVEYPSADPRLNTQEVADWNLKMIGRLRQQYPHFKARLEVIETKWQNAMSFAKQLARQQSWTDASAATGNTAPAENPTGRTVAFASLPVERPTVAPTSKPDPFVRFGGTGLDSRKGFIGSQSALGGKGTGSLFHSAIAKAEIIPVNSTAQASSPVEESTVGDSLNATVSAAQRYLQELANN